MTPTVSVVISTFNRSTSVARAIVKLAGQRASVPFEVIIVDNNSKDDTRAVVGAQIERFPHVPITYVVEPRQGVSHGRNRGILTARAPIVAFTDDDVTVGPDWVQTIADAFDAHPEIDCVGGPVLPCWTTPPPDWLTRNHWGPLAVVEYGNEPIYIDAERPLCLLTANVAYRRAALDRIGYFSPEFPRCQDHELLLRFWRHGGRCLYLPTLVADAEVPRSRTEWRYHRAWHTQHGYYCARMHDDGIGPHAGPSPRGRRLTFLGTPAVLYRELLGSLKRFASCALRGDIAGRRESEGRIHHLASFIGTRHSMWRETGGSTPSEIARFVRRSVADRLSPCAAKSTLPLRERIPAYVLVTVLIAGSAFDIIKDEEHWPFSQYPMFSAVDESRTFESLRLFGVVEGGRAEIPLLHFDHLKPLDQCRLSTSLSWMSKMADGPDRLEDVLRQCFVSYEARREDGKHDGPALSGVRLYRCRWVLRSDASNSDAPDSRELLLQVTQEPGYRAGATTP